MTRICFIHMVVGGLLLGKKLRPNVHENWGVGTGSWDIRNMSFAEVLGSKLFRYMTV